MSSAGNQGHGHLQCGGVQVDSAGRAGGLGLDREPQHRPRRQQEALSHER